MQPVKWPCHLLAVHIVSQLDDIPKVVDRIMAIVQIPIFSKFEVCWTNFDVWLTVNLWAMPATPQISGILLVTGKVHFDSSCHERSQSELVSGLC